MIHHLPPPVSFQPCRRRHRDALLSSVYHNTPFFRGLITALDDGLNRHSPCHCPSCVTHNKRSAPSCLYAPPPPKRARRRSPPRPTWELTFSASIYYCHWCSFPDHSVRLSCRECGRRRAPPAMAQHFHVERTPLESPISEHTTTDNSYAFTSPEPTSSIHHTSTDEPFTPLSEEDTNPSASCNFAYSPRYSATDMAQVRVSVPLQHYAQHGVEPVQVEYNSPRSTILDATEITDYESVCTPESFSVASKNLAHVQKQEYPIGNHYRNHGNEQEITVASLMQDVSREVSKDAPSPHAVGSRRLSLVSSSLSDVTSKSAIALSGVENGPTKSTQGKGVLEHDVADMFLSEIILSDDEKELPTSNDLPDLPFNMFLDGILPLNEQDA